MNQTMPRAPFAAGLSRSARETERRIRNLFAGPRKDPPFPIVILTALLVLLCGNLVSCQKAQSPGSSQQEAESSAQQGADNSVQAEPDAGPAVPLPTPDLNRNGIPEEIRLENKSGALEVSFYENGELLVREQSGVYLCRLDGADYILRCFWEENQGAYRYGYNLTDFSREFNQTFYWNSYSFDTNFATPFHTNFDPEVIAAYTEELNVLLMNSVHLVARYGPLLADKPPTLTLLAEEPSMLTLDWLDSYPGFTQDPDKSLLDNLKAFQAAPVWTPLAPQAGAALPSTEPIRMAFLSGAGGWQTDLTLNPDGTFTGDYCEGDPNTHYVCQFHGSFRTDAQLSPASWQLTLEELVLDTKYPVGQEWDEDGIHNISSELYGFNGTDGKALKPGAVFILYSPEAQGHAPGTELYGAYELFLGWREDYHALQTAGDTLGCWGLYNLEACRGFFAYDWLASDS